MTWRDDGRGALDRPLFTAWEVLTGPVAPRTWRATVHLVTGGAVAALAGSLIAALATLTAALVLTIVTVPVGVMLLLAASRLFGTVQRRRFAALTGVVIPPIPPSGRRGTFGRLAAEVRSPRVWRQVAFHVVALLTETLGGFLVLLGWAVGLVLATSFLYGEGLRALGIDALPAQNVYGWHLQDTDVQTVMTIAGVAVLFAVPWLARWFTVLDVTAAVALLGPSRSEELTERVESLAESRAAVVDAADAERRRIERDLHDGAQQRLVSLAMNLGMIRAMFPDLPGAARDAIAEAHEEAKQALAELRDLVRGLHPAVLNDRGLDAALSGIAGRSPVPVKLSVDLPERPSATIEAVAYFVVSESLANVAKHSKAGAAEVTVARHDGRIRLVIRDDGVGGATADGGTGLRGLTQRVASIDGTLHVHSPRGGPTTITVELPCA